MAIRIVVVDDHAVFRSGLRTLLEREEDLEVVGEAGDGEATLALLRHTPCDVLLLDISMPGMNGPRTADAVRQEFPKTAIVVLTMHEDEHYLRELFRLGAKGYVLKKSTGTEVAQAIRSAAGGQLYIDPAMTSVLLQAPGETSNTDERREEGVPLTPREREICQLLALGHTNSEVGEKLSISMRTVETHRYNIMAKLGLKSRADLVRYAIDHGLMPTQ